MTIHRGITICLLACVVTSATVGCSTMKTLYPVQGPARASSFAKLKVGQEVVIETHDGRRERVVVQRIESDAIVSERGARYAEKDIVRIQRKAFSPVRAALWTIVGIVGAVALLGGAAFFPS